MTIGNAATTPTLVIIGNGVAGITAARTARRLDPQLRIQIVSDESDFFYSRTALMYIYMGHMRLQDTEPYERAFYAQNRLELVRARVEQIDTAGKRLKLAGGSEFRYDYLLIATGALPNRFGWPGQDLKRVQGLYGLNDLESLEEATQDGAVKQAVIVGGGLIGIELAEMLHTRGIHVTFLVREENYWDNVLPREEAMLINEEIREHGMELRLKSNLKEILDDGAGGARAVTVAETGEMIPCQLVGLTAGVSPNTGVVQNSGIQVGRGVLVDRRLRTNIDNVFAAGDCAELRNPGEERGTVEQLWYTGRMQGEVAGMQIARLSRAERGHSLPDTPYDRGIWFNSAKFLTVEYQTYGFVPRVPEPERTHVWIDEKRRRLIRLVWETNGPDTRVTGFNLFNVRYRQEICAAWIREERPVDYVLKHLERANFDPEFFNRPERAFRRDYKNRRGMVPA
ncbi:MAG: FAD-dependent oxidoreductase [Spirochaetales bacterium]|nr:FAD-dependent oxidoreductase [Leptospiraceae bacterium]MCP5481694.1 FAD-dependent oxidoreductase [Spirochaetales bacterium]